MDLSVILLVSLVKLLAPPLARLRCGICPLGQGGSAARGSRIPIISQCEASRVKCRIGEVRQGLACLGNLVLSKVDNIEPFALDCDSNFTVRDGIRQNLQSIAACLP
jgi:hypothetical protein